MKQKRNMTRVLVALLSLALVFTMMPLSGPITASYAADAGTLKISSPLLTVTGTGLIGEGGYSASSVSAERSFSLEELKAMGETAETIYTAKKQRKPFTKSYHAARGVRLDALVADLASRPDRISLIASDGYVCAFQKGGTYRNEAENVSGLGSLGKDMDYSKLADITPAPGLGQARYAYRDFSAENAVQVPALIAWNYEESDDTDVSAGSEDRNLKFFVGQLGGTGYDGPEDMNGPLLNGGSKAAIRQVLVGDHISETALTVDQQAYTRANLLAMDFAERSYSYQTSSGDATDYVRGVPISVLLQDCSEDDVVSFETADGYPVEASGYTVRDLVSNDYMLAYEKGTGPSDLQGIYDTAKKDPSQYGFFRLYGSDEKGKPSKLINRITVSSGSGINFAASPYKHITNGGITGQTGPYNIDAITGATLTVEGPGTETSVPLSVKDMEGRNAGCARGVYTDSRAGKAVKRTYEGVDLYYILHEMSNGDNGIRLTDKAKQVKIKNRNRQTIAELSLDQIRQMHEDKRPALVSYGTAYEDGTDPRPFVFDGGTGANKALGNEDGCLKFVYDRDQYGGNTDYKTFGNMAYIYVEEEKTPGFKHDKAPYNTSENSKYVLTVTGDAMGREVNYKVQDLEKLVEYDASGNVKDNGYGWRSEYSLANSSYWYVNTYEGIKLWSLLVHSGIDPAKAGDTNTKVTFRSTDNYGGFDTFTLKQVADPDSFGFYEKNANDNNDGTYVPNENLRKGNDVTTGDKLSTGYPVLVSYGVNEYPYVIDRKLDGYLSGLSNDGGPLRVISGKMNYAHANGSNQAKLLDRIVVGDETYHYSTHTYQPADSAYKKQASSKLTVTIRNGTSRKKKTYRVSSLEKILYGGSLSAAQLKEARVKNFYETGRKGAYTSDLYEGMDLQYFLKEVVQLQGSQGKITFKSGKKKLTLDLKTALKTTRGYNGKEKVGGLSPVIAFAKNGYPLVKSSKSKGYEKQGSLTKAGTSSAEATSYRIKNSGGPLRIIFPRASKKSKKIMGSLANVTSIVIDLKPDKYAHVTKPYNKLSSKKLTVEGAGTRIAGRKTFTVDDLEGRQSIILTRDYTVRNKKKKVTQMRYRGLPLYEFLKSTDVGLKTSADKVRIYTKERPKKPYEFTLSQIMKTDYMNTRTGKKNLPVMLAFGSAPVKFKDRKKGRPLVVSARSRGYSKTYKNSGGPLKLVVGQTGKKDVNSGRILKNVTRIEVTSGEGVSWNHSSSEVFRTYLDDTLELKVTDGTSTIAEKTLTVAQLEAMKDLISQEEIYAVKKNTWEGLNFWQLLQKEFAGVAGMDDPVTITVAAKDGYSVDAVEKAGLDGLKNGIKDGDSRIPVMLAYGVDGYPLAAGGKQTPTGEGYDSTVDNKGGPLRLMVHNAQGACIMEVISVTIQVRGAKAAAGPEGIMSSGKTNAAARPEALTGSGRALVQAFAKAGPSLAEVLLPEAAYAGEETAPGFTVYEGTGREGQLPMAGIRSVMKDRDGTLWIGTNGGGVASLPEGAETFQVINGATDPAISGTVTYAVCPDGTGGVWISQGSNDSESYGVAYLKEGKLRYYAEGEGTIASNFVQEVKADPAGRVWFGTSKGLTCYDPETGAWKSWGKVEDSKGKAAPAEGEADAGAARASEEVNRHAAPADGIVPVDFPAQSVDNIEIDSTGGLWCGFYPDANGDGTYTGGFAYFKDGALVKSYSYTSRKDANTDFYRMGDVWVRDIAIDPAGGAWAIASGSYKGMENAGGTVWYAAKPGGKAKTCTGFDLVGEKYLKGTSQQTNPELRMISFDGEGRLWLGTSADGLLCVDDPVFGGGKLTVNRQFKADLGSWPEGFDSIYSLDAWEKDLYAGTNSGLAVLDLTTLPAPDRLADQKPALKSIKAGRKKATLRWKKVTGVSGYTIYRATRKNGKYKRIKTIKKATTLKYTNTKMKKGKTYYYRIRAYKKAGDGKVWTKYSAPKKVRIKR